MKKYNETIGSMFIKRVNISPNRNAIGWIDHGQLKFYNFSDYKNIVSNAACGIHFTTEQDWKVAIWANTSKEWHLLDLACLTTARVVVPIYPNLSIEEITYILKQAEVQCIYIDSREQLLKLIKIKDQIPNLKQIIYSFDLKGDDLNFNYISYNELLEIGAKSQKKNSGIFTKVIEAVSPDAIATIIYTSGTTGIPKGAVIKQKAIYHMLHNISASTNGTFSQRDRSLIFLPLSHVFGRTDSFLAINFGLTMFFFQSIEEAFANIQLVKPTIFLTVPRVLEKIKEKFDLILSTKSNFTKKIYSFSKRRGDEYFEDLTKKKNISIFEKIEREFYYKTIFKHVKDYLGGNLRFIVSGGASLRSDLYNFFRDANITVLEGYGLTETIAPCTINPINKQIIGSVGRPVGDVELSFGEDSEIYIKSKAMFSGYYKDKESTDKAFVNGWFKTGDIGIILEDNFLKITDRKRDIIVTSSGKNIAPQKIEGMLNENNIFSNSVVIGNDRNYLCALLFIDREYILANKEKFGITESPSHDELSKNKNMLTHAAKAIENVNNELARFEQIKKYKIMPFQLGIHNYLTPSLKIKKKVLIADYKELINTMY